jgi:hypothetical protein
MSVAYRAILEASQEVPPTTSTGSGLGTFVFDGSGCAGTGWPVCPVAPALPAHWRASYGGHPSALTSVIRYELWSARDVALVGMRCCTSWHLIASR